MSTAYAPALVKSPTGVLISTSSAAPNNKAPIMGPLFWCRNWLRYHRNVNFLAAKVNIRNRAFKPTSLSDFLCCVDWPTASSH